MDIYQLIPEIVAWKKELTAAKEKEEAEKEKLAKEELRKDTLLAKLSEVPEKETEGIKLY